MNQEMVKAEKRFANHKARLDILDENVRVLNWRQPGTQAYAIRAVMDGYHVYITGDLGSAVICLTETATLKALSGYWKKPGYFMEKFVCTTDDYFFDYETAKGELRERSYTQEYLDAIERNTPPRNGAPIGRDSFEWAGCAEELSVCNVAHLLAAAKRTPGYFQVRSALCGMPVIRERYADTMALLNKVKGTDAYDILAQLMQQAEREA